MYLICFRIHTGVPIYRVLVQHVHKKQHTCSEQTTCVDINIREDDDGLLSDVAVTRTPYVVQFNLHLSLIYHYYTEKKAVGLSKSSVAGYYRNCPLDKCTLTQQLCSNNNSCVGVSTCNLSNGHQIC